jgi:hypothetical protein
MMLNNITVFIKSSKDLYYFFASLMLNIIFVKQNLHWIKFALLQECLGCSDLGFAVFLALKMIVLFNLWKKDGF